MTVNPKRLLAAAVIAFLLEALVLSLLGVAGLLLGLVGFIVSVVVSAVIACRIMRPITRRPQAVDVP